MGENKVWRNKLKENKAHESFWSFAGISSYASLSTRRISSDEEDDET